MLVACTAAPLFNVLSDEASVRSALQGVADAAFITLLVGCYMIFLRDGSLRGWFRRFGFWTDLALSSAILLALFLVGRGLGQVVTSLEPRRFVASFGDEHLIYALPFSAVLAFGVEFVVQMNRVAGANVLRHFMTGTYHRPTAEERIFLFLDLEGSTRHAERLGSARYFELLQRFVDDLTEPVLASQGEIYQYAGDEVVVTWRLDDGLRDAHCVRCFFGVRAAIERQAARYLHDFGAVPRFRAGLHGGPVTAGELGDLKRQIVFVGDILNTAARLEEVAKQRRLDLVASESLLARLAMPPGVVVVPCGELQLRGRQAPLRACSLSTSPAAVL